MSQINRVSCVRLSPHVLQIAVPTPTLPPSFSTNTYLIHAGRDGILVDAGSADTDLLAAVEAIVDGTGVTNVVALVATHWHRDHVVGLPHLHQTLGAPIHIHPVDLSKAAAEMQVAANELLATPSAFLLHDVAVTVQHAPGHTHGHIHVCVQPDGVILVGDHLAGDGSVWIGPPDGHMADYFRALDAIAASACAIAGPGHGQALMNAADAAHVLKERRLRRETEIYERIAQAPVTLAQLVAEMYRGTIADEALWVAKKTVQAHIAHLMDHARITCTYDDSIKSFRYAHTPSASAPGEQSKPMNT